MRSGKAMLRCKQQSWRMVVLFSMVLLLGVSEAGWVDPDSPKDAKTTAALSADDDRQYQLVFSDEFEQDGRTFDDGNDPRWTAINKNDYTNAALHFYSKENVRTSNGVLNITTEFKDNIYKAFNEKKKKFYVDTKHVQTGMVQGWNKFCFIGGIVEFSAKLPGDPKVGGLWPALWMLGNLARATYVGSADFIWPYSYNKCSEETRLSQEINGCQRVAHYGLEPGVGRGSAEIDIIEAMQGDAGKLPSTHIQRPYQSCSLQIAPGIQSARPVLGSLPHKGHWYTDLEYGNESGAELNPFFYGVTLVHEPKSYTYQSDAISANMQLNTTHYDTQHIYRIEWEPPEADGSGGYVKWFTDGDPVFAIYGKSLTITQTEIPSEPMYLIMNTAVSSHWGFPAPCPEGCKCECFECGNPDCACALPTGYCDNFPASFEIEYVRVYQAVNESRHVLGCSPEGRPTETFIKGHKKRYMVEGQKRPLEPVRSGGGYCASDEDCGGVDRGYCDPKRGCVCQDTFTGPACLAHAGFYDVDTRAKLKPFRLSSMMVPRSLIWIIGILFLGFGISLTGTLRTKSKETKYHEVSNTNMTFPALSSAPYGANTSYQNSASADYVLPKQKVVTYCVIDGRLVDS